MNLVLPFLGVAMAALVSWVLSLGGHFAHRLSEQVRLDALTISVCHHRKNFIQDKIVDTNSEIKWIQRTMDATALPCFLAMTSPAVVASPAICNGVKATLQGLSKSANVLERLQDARRLQYLNTQQNLQKDLIKKNNLGADFGSLSPPHLVGGLELDGFSREESEPQRKLMELFFGVDWPQQLKANSTFKAVHIYSSEFKPHRLWVGVQENSKTWDGVTAHQHKNINTSAAKSQSGCRVTQKSETKFEVARWK